MAAAAERFCARRHAHRAFGLVPWRIPSFGSSPKVGGPVFPGPVFPPSGDTYLRVRAQGQHLHLDRYLQYQTHSPPLSCPYPFLWAGLSMPRHLTMSMPTYQQQARFQMPGSAFPPRNYTTTEGYMHCNALHHHGHPTLLLPIPPPQQQAQAQDPGPAPCTRHIDQSHLRLPLHCRPS